MMKMRNGCGTVNREIATDTRDLQFELYHRNDLFVKLLCTKWRKVKTMQKRPEWPIIKKINSIIGCCIESHFNCTPRPVLPATCFIEPCRQTLNGTSLLGARKYPQLLKKKKRILSLAQLEGERETHFTFKALGPTVLNSSPYLEAAVELCWWSTVPWPCSGWGGASSDRGRLPGAEGSLEPPASPGREKHRLGCQPEVKVFYLHSDVIRHLPVQIWFIYFFFSVQPLSTNFGLRHLVTG